MLKELQDEIIVEFSAGHKERRLLIVFDQLESDVFDSGRCSSMQVYT